ncbi:uncharacterized protein LOC135488832 isoform X10 [Lineus longissimus]|uniref:uncharacterized protein LOC135488832 isoform X10 n=1 Tax=Lineus longissimus TaxID=88925 RepID=UPI00315D8362
MKIVLYLVMASDCDLSFQMSHSDTNQGCFSPRLARFRSQELLLISEEDLIDSVFYNCDQFSKGTVSVTCLVEYLRKTTEGKDGGLNCLDDLDELSTILDPDSRDVEVDLEEYRTGMNYWIRTIRQRSHSNSSCDMDSEEESGMSSSTFASQDSGSCLSPVEPVKTMQDIPGDAESWQQICLCKLSNGIINGSEAADISYGSLEASGEDTTNSHQDEIDNLELANKLANLQHHNKKINDDNIKLQMQLEVTEDTIYQKAMEIEELEKKIWNMQDSIDKSKDVFKENEELKLTISHMEETNRTQQLKLREVEKEKSELEGHLSDSRNKEFSGYDEFLKAFEELQEAKVHQEELFQQFNEHKERYNAIQEMNDLHQADELKRQNAFEEVQGHVEDLTKTNKCLKKEKEELEKELNQTRQDYMDRMMSSDLMSDEEDEGEDLMPVKIIPGAASTPVSRALPSILSELKDCMVNDDDSLPSPFCEKDGDASLSFNLDDSSFDVDREVAVIMSSKKPKKGLPTPSKIVSQFHQKMDTVLQYVHQMNQLNKGLDSEHNWDVMIKRLEKNIHATSRKLAKKMREKDESDFLVTKLKQAVKKLKEEKDVITVQYNRAMKEMEDDVVSMDMTLDARLGMLKETLRKTHAELQSSQLEAAVYKEEAKEMNRNVEQLLVVREENEQKLHEMQDTIKRLNIIQEEKEERIKELSANLELAEKCHQTELDLKEELSRSHDLLLEEFRKTSKLEESLAAALSNHGVDLKDVWRLVQKDIDNECSTSEEKSTPNTASEDSVKDQVIRDISVLKDRLAKRQIALATLSAKTLSLGDVMVQCRSNPNSPLVEALILEKFEEAVKRKANKQISASIHSFLSTKETSTSTASLVSRQQHAQSCPLLLPANATSVTCSTQTDEATDASNSISGLSTTESFTAVTSESVNMQVNSIGQSKCLMAVLSGQDTVQSVALQQDLPNNASQSPGLSRERSSSFKAAIEKSQTTPVQPQYYPIEAEIISSTDTTPDVAHPTSTPQEPFSFKQTGLVNLGNTEHFYSNSKAPVLPMFDINFSFSELANNTSTGMITDYSSQLDPYSEEIRSSFMQQQDGEELETEAGLPDTDDKRASPRHGRKLSTLIEEGSDAEAEESLTESVSAAEGQQTSSPAHQSYSPANSRQNSLDEMKIRYSPSNSRQSSLDELKVRGGSPSVLPPEYKSPPEYRKTSKDRMSEFRLTKQDHISPGHTPRNLSPVNVPPMTESATQSSQSLSPKPPKSSVTFKLDTLTVDSHGKPKSPPSPFRLTTSKSTSTQLSPLSFSAPFTGVTAIIGPSSPKLVPHITKSNSAEVVKSLTGVKFKLEKSHSDEGVRNFGVQTSPILLRAHLFHSNSAEESEMPRPSPQYASPPEYRKEPPLLSFSMPDDPSEVELSEADKLLNAQILEEAKKASMRRHNRRPRRNHSTSDTSSDNSMSLEDNFRSEDSQDFSHVSQLNGPIVSITPPPITTNSTKKLKSSKGMKVGFDFSEPEPPAELIKREIFQGVSSDPSAPDLPSSRTLKGGQLAKIREEHLKKRGLKHVTMPELAETSETESVKGSGGSMDSDSDRSSHGDKMAEINITANPIYPSLPDHYLEKLGVDKNSEVSPDKLSEEELEEKFASLSLAFKTDKQTLEQRKQLQERARDMAEQNVDKELEGIRKTIKDLGQFCADAECREVVTKLQQHIEVLEQSTARVSSRAELHGAVQQEDRMNRAIEIMVTHVDRLRLLYEREHQELEETRKLLQENRILPPGAAADFDSPLTKRSLSIAGAQGKSGHHSHLRNHTGALTSSRLGQSSASSQLDEAGKRRASVAAFPRLFGSLGSSSGNLNPKQRFQNVVANTTLTNSITGFLRRSSQDRSKTPPPDSSNNDSTTPEPLKIPAPATTKHMTLSPDDALKKPSPIKKQDTNANDRRTSNSKLDEKEEVFQKGFEQGVRTSISAELNDLREQQALFCDSLENLMEDNQEDEEDDEENKEHFLDKMWQYVPEWDKSGKKLRLILASIIFTMGLLSIMVTLMPVAAAPVPRQSLQEMVSPYVQLKYFGKKPL